jgi:hypothetical protein
MASVFLISSVLGHLAEGLRRVQLVRAGALEDLREPVCRLVEDLRDLQDFLGASHRSASTVGWVGWSCRTAGSLAGGERPAVGGGRFVRGQFQPPARFRRVGEDE